MNFCYLKCIFVYFVLSESLIIDKCLKVFHLNVLLIKILFNVYTYLAGICKQQKLATFRHSWCNVQQWRCSVSREGHVRYGTDLST